MAAELDHHLLLPHRAFRRARLRDWQCEVAHSIFWDYRDSGCVIQVVRSSGAHPDDRRG
jgi:hypothetical protein